MESVELANSCAVNLVTYMYYKVKLLYLYFYWLTGYDKLSFIRFLSSHQFLIYEW